MRPSPWLSDVALALAFVSAARGPAAAPARRAVPPARRAATRDWWACVTNEHAGSLTIIDGATRRAIATIRIGRRPRGIHASPDGRWLYVALRATSQLWRCRVTIQQQRRARQHPAIGSVGRNHEKRCWIACVGHLTPQKGPMARNRTTFAPGNGAARKSLNLRSTA